MKKRIIPIVLLVAVIVAAGLLWSARRNRDDDRIVRLSGNLELTQADMSFKAPGKLIARLVNEGDNVKKGEMLARLDAQQAADQHTRDVAAIRSAQSSAEQLRTQIEWQRATLEGDVATRAAEVRAAQAVAEQLETGSRPQEKEQAQAAVQDARSQFQQASADWQRAQELFKNEDISKAQYDQYEMRFRSTRALLDQAQQRQALVLEGPRKEEIRQAQAQYARAKGALAVSEANRLELKRKEEELVARRAEIERAKAQAGISESQLQDMSIYAPFDGVVLTKSAEPGEVLAAGATVVTIGDLDHPWVRGYIRETDLGKVKLGQRVKLTTDSFPGKTYSGTITFISSEAEFTPKQIQTTEERVKLVYRIKIEVDNSTRELKSNMPVDAVIEL
jgi:HlyD family secretion protein